MKLELKLPPFFKSVAALPTNIAEQGNYTNEFRWSLKGGIIFLPEICGLQYYSSFIDIIIV